LIRPTQRRSSPNRNHPSNDRNERSNPLQVAKVLKTSRYSSTLAEVRALVQRTTRASVTVDNEIKGVIGQGLVILLGVARDDAPAAVPRLAERVARLRIFPNEAGRFDRSLLDIAGAALVVSQFTLYGDTTTGNRPSMSAAAPPELAEPIYERFVRALRDVGVPRVETGVFGASMAVELVNDGPVTLLLEG
jgi:D-tyrosyl-tRNA(Tyr) deacylase